MRRVLSLVPEKPQSWCSASPCAADQSSMVVSLCWPTRQRVTTPRTMPRYVFTPERPRPRSRRPVAQSPTAVPCHPPRAALAHASTTLTFPGCWDLGLRPSFPLTSWAYWPVAAGSPASCSTKCHIEDSALQLSLVSQILLHLGYLWNSKGRCDELWFQAAGFGDAGDTSACYW